MSLVARPPSSHTAPPTAPRIGTAGSPLDLPALMAQSPREGLGLGGVNMPEEMKGSAEDKDRKFDTRYLAFKPPRAGHFRHAASVSSPPSLIPFVKSLHSSTSSTSASGPPAPTVTSRKFSLPPQGPSRGLGHSREKSEGMISYPIVSRLDTLPTFTPDEERRPAPVPTTTINCGPSQHATPLAPSRSIEEERTPTPRQRRPSRTTRSPPPPLDLDFTGVSNYSVFPVKSTAAPLKARRGSDVGAAKERLEKMTSSSVGNRLKGLRISRNSSIASSQFDSSEDEDGSPMIGSTGRTSYPAAPPPHMGHLRSASEESPRIVQAMTFNRARSAEEVLPSAAALKQRLDHGGPGSAAAPGPTRTWNTASPALIPISEVKAAKAKAAKALDSPTKKSSNVPTPTRATPTKLLSEVNSAISISVKDSFSSSSKEYGKTPLGRDGVTVCLKSYTKPEDLEVSWTCVSRTDEEGRAFTQWETKFKPRTSPSPSSLPPAQSLPPLPTPAHSMSNSSFLNYRINAPSSVHTNYPQVGRTQSTTSPLSQGIDPLVATALSQNEGRRRKSSSTSTSRSDSFSNGTSFSSESSMGPLTPASSISGHRRRKSSSISHSLSAYDLENSKLPPPPLPTQGSYFDIPVPPTSRAAPAAHDRPESPSRTNRASSYNVGRTTRQFSIDPSVYVPRSASVPEAGMLVSAPSTSSTSSTSSVATTSVNSPRDNRFARCLPPTSESVSELAMLTSSSISPSSSNTSIGSTSGGSFLASRGARKQSIAPPPSLSIPPPPAPSSSFEESSHTTRLTSPFTPSPLGRSNVVYSSADQNRTPTRPTHHSKVFTTTPSPPPPARNLLSSYQYEHNVPLPPSSSTEASFISAESRPHNQHYDNSRSIGEKPQYGGGGTSEELVSYMSPSFSTDDDDYDVEEEEDDEEEREAQERMGRVRQGKRMMSRWSDTETEEEAGHSQLDDSKGLTSWGRLPDSNTTDEE